MKHQASCPHQFIYLNKLFIYISYIERETEIETETERKSR